MNILFLCTANIQRSKTAEEVFSSLDKSNDYRSAGLSYKYTQKMGSTLCTEEMLQWADSVYVFEDMHIERVKQHTGEKHLHKLVNFQIEDKYQYFQRELVLLLLDKYPLQANMSSK